jgi:isocitrate/isopropylmalate dehydrogenase
VRVYESFHGKGRDPACSNQANPLPLLLPALEMLPALGYAEPASRIRRAVESVLTAARVQTADLGGRASTMEMAQAIVAALG